MDDAAFAFVDELKDALIRLTHGLGEAPAREVFGESVEIGDPAGEIGDDGGFRLRGRGDERNPGGTGILAFLQPLPGESERGPQLLIRGVWEDVAVRLRLDDPAVLQLRGGLSEVEKGDFVNGVEPVAQGTSTEGSRKRQGDQGDHRGIRALLVQPRQGLFTSVGEDSLEADPLEACLNRSPHGGIVDDDQNGGRYTQTTSA